MQLSPAFLQSLDRPGARVASGLCGLALIAGWLWGDRALRAEPGRGLDPMWLAFVGLVVVALALAWIWNAVFQGRRDRDGVALSTVGLLVCTTAGVFAGTLGLLLELFWRAEPTDTVLRMALRGLWHAVSAFTLLLVLSPITLRLLGSLPLRDRSEEVDRPANPAA